jgi:hypothetical protein
MTGNTGDADMCAYARGFHARFGDRATAYARDYAEQLRATGDVDGHDVWQRVAELIRHERGRGGPTA